MTQVPAGWLRRTVARALAEDVGAGDVTTAAVVPPGQKGRAVLIARQELVLAGAAAFEEVFAQVGGVEVEFHFQDGDPVPAGETAATVKGSLASILTGERVALNFVMRLSGIATLTAEYAKAVKGTGCAVTDTRKTTPGLRALEKAAVIAGGGTSHRSGLFDGVLIKDNHVAAAGSVTEAVARTKKAAPHTLSTPFRKYGDAPRRPMRRDREARDRVVPAAAAARERNAAGADAAVRRMPSYLRNGVLRIEVEVGKLHQLSEAIEAGADIVMLDNMSPDDARRAVEIAAGRVLIEASGGMTLQNVRAYAETGVDIISVGRLTHSAPAADMALKIRK
ncbi:MAG: carboxylating nicotinate-nucleotide diphosphorylase [Deltaproteobacteria bacterium]|nr:carboxylating nicotinate-nucleotide diphosphorylase [Deltaproteobacteria bacterium]